ncbi:Cysteine-rich secretory protein family protein [Roseovarius lutimaris]|uniref:Cysteine-rich secretory protein family protein n=1 Tax=Roseovarius lutimaris TaxID=1005928 RepID=A0A1I5DN02_9RHOB|nr:CAP domain-containing protein [Roseovarius lutimaris]SFO00629.1 Cysteine-rich secretory protein family protein [Roseovarius lutimaris]
MPKFRLLGLVAYVMMFALPMTSAQAQATDFGPASLDRVNAARAKSGRGAITLSPKLTRAAAAHARDMAENRYFGHTGANGSSIGDRVGRQQYRFCFVAENIAKGQGTLDEVLRGWMASPGHRQNMLHKSAAEYGLVRGPGSLWVMVLGRSGC